jgi:hypothetical protein
MSQDTLSKFGTEFQAKCIASLLYDRSFLEQSLDVIKSSFFESDADRWIVEKTMWYFQTYKSVPTIPVFKKEIAKIDNDDTLRASIIDHLRAIHNNQTADDLKYVKDELLKFCKNQAIKEAILKSADLLGQEKYDHIKTIIDKAMHAGVERNLGHNWHNDIDLRVAKMSRNVVATPWQAINDITDGGLGAGELGCVIAPSGIGKSWILAAIGAAALRQGKRVVHYTFELQENYLGLRYDTIFTGIEPNKVRDNVEVVRNAMKDVEGELIIKYFPTRSANVTMLMAHINRLISLGQRPDIILVDYADLMRSVSPAASRHEELGFIHEEIRGMLGELKVPGWTASQSQRSSLQDEIVEADKIAGSYAKIMADDFVMSASRKLADKVADTARVHVIKNRFGADGQTFPSQMDLARGKIDIFDENSTQYVLTKHKMQSGEGTVKAMLAKKLIDLKKTNDTSDND